MKPTRVRRRRRTHPLTPRRVWRRGREVVRDEGWWALLFMVLADLGYRRFLVLERRLDEPIPAIEPRATVTFARLAPSEIDVYLPFHGADPREQLEERFARGDECFVARSEGRIVGTSWVSRGEHLIRSLGYRYAIGPTEVYLHDSYVTPGFRGRGIAPALGAHVLRELLRAGVTRATMAVSPENVANQRARAKTGFRVCGRIDSIRIGPWSWAWQTGGRGATPRRRRRSPRP